MKPATKHVLTMAENIDADDLEYDDGEPTYNPNMPDGTATNPPITNPQDPAAPAPDPSCPTQILNAAIGEPIATGKITAALANELASELNDIDTVLANFDLTAEQFRHISATSMFKEMYKEARALWHSANNATERVRIKTTMAAEDLVLEAYRRASDPDTSTDAFTRLWKQIIDTSKAAPVKHEQAGTGEKFTININIGGHDETIVAAPHLDPLDTTAIDAEFTGT